MKQTSEEAKRIIAEVEAKYQERVADLRQPVDSSTPYDYELHDEVSLRHGLLLVVIAGVSEGYRFFKKLLRRRTLFLCLSLAFISVMMKSCTGNDGSHWSALGCSVLLIILVLTVFFHSHRFSIK